MTDVVIRLAVKDGEEAQLFGHYLNRFIEGHVQDAEQAADSDAPYLMVRTDPQTDMDLKVLTFQHGGAARAFRLGWARATRGRFGGLGGALTATA